MAADTRNAPRLFCFISLLAYEPDAACRLSGIFCFLRSSYPAQPVASRLGQDPG